MGGKHEATFGTSSTPDGDSTPPRGDLTPQTRASIYQTVGLLAGLVCPLGAAWGVTIDQSVPAIIVAVAGSLLGSGGVILARRNVSVP